MSVPTSIPTSREYEESLEDSLKLANLVTRLMELRDREAGRLIGKTTTTGYRRVHEYLTSAIDRALELCRKAKGEKRLGDSELAEINLLISRSLILVNYQEARDQLSRDLADALRSIIHRILNSISSRREAVNVERLEKMLESARTIIDALAVLVYRYA